MSHVAVSTQLRRPRNQTPEHYALTLLAYGWLWRHGCRVIGFEVPIGAWVFDVVGLKWPRGKDQTPRIFVIEAKGHRSDFRQEVARKARAEGAVERLRLAREAMTALGITAEIRHAVRHLVADARTLHHPLVLDGLERRFGRVVSAAEVEVVAELDKAEAAVRKHRQWGRGPDGAYGEVAKVGKLWCETVLAETSARYVIACDGVVQDGELPPGWGFLSSTPAIVTRCLPTPSAPERASRILAHMARAFTYRVKDGLPGRHSGTDVSLPSFDDLVEASR
ncbi:MAG: hypothetical protein Q8Q14_00685 [Gemmatimonadales bacterium]|nr:hypothetical protein [Gemmatimonadales bacterium]